MNTTLFFTVKEFLERHLKPGAPILLGISGGPDSLALFYLLLECKIPLDLHLAHIDHGWRAESKEEAKLLAKIAEEHKLPFHLHTLEELPTNNLEEHGRKERLKFFSKIYKEKGCQALLLAHQADDQAETIFKRVCEGASLLFFAAMQPVSELEGMQVWRPLLNTPKEKILDWLKERGHTPFSDPSNQDARFLRARLRNQILPDLSRQFGKEVRGSFLRLGEAAQELSSYVHKKIEPHLQKISKHTPALDLADISERVERKALIRHFLDVHGASISYETLETLLDLLEARTSRRTPCRTLALKGATLVLLGTLLTVYVTRE